MPLHASVAEHRLRLDVVHALVAVRGLGVAHGAASVDVHVGVDEGNTVVTAFTVQYCIATYDFLKQESQKRQSRDRKDI